MKLKLDVEKLRELLITFYNVAKVRTVIFDDEFNKITAYPDDSCPFCTLMKRNPTAKQLCRDNDKKACADCKESKQLCIYKCHAGLFEAVAPIKMNDIILGYIMLGQVSEKGADAEKTLQYASRFAEDRDALQRAYKKLSQKDAQQIESLAKLMEICTCYLEITKLISIDEENMIFHLSNYVNDNICSDLKVEDILSNFKISRFRLYEISHKYFGMSIAKYIRHKRVLIAAEYLKQKSSRVSEAAERAGFTDYNYFSKIFKNEMGVTPSSYKKQYQEQVTE